MSTVVKLTAVRLYDREVIKSVSDIDIFVPFATACLVFPLNNGSSEIFLYASALIASAFAKLLLIAILLFEDSNFDNFKFT